MSTIKVIPESGFIGDGVKKSQIKLLVANYYDKMLKKKGTLTRKLDKAKDAKSVWFPKESIDKLFEDNGNDSSNNKEYGLRIYFGVHEKGILEDGQGNDVPSMYFNQQTVVLVTTRNQNNVEDQDLLTETNFVHIAGYTGNGLDNGKLCPPQICNGATINID